MRLKSKIIKVNVDEQPIEIDCLSSLSATEDNFQDMHNNGWYEIRQIIDPHIDYCQERLDGTYNISADKLYTNTELYKLQTNKDYLIYYMEKFYLHYKAGKLEEEYYLPGELENKPVPVLPSNLPDIPVETVEDKIEEIKVYTIDEINEEYQKFINNLIEKHKIETEQKIKTYLSNKTFDSVENFEKDYLDFIEMLKQL